MYNLEIEPLFINFSRTIRVEDNKEPASLPPSLGSFEIYKVSDYKCPENWEQDAYFIAMHDQEAMWISLQSLETVAFMLGVGNINALTGKTYEEKLEVDGYGVTPPQPWIDGWKNDDGTVSQFVATIAGETKTIAEQLSDTKNHAITISIFKAKNPEQLAKVGRPNTLGVDYCCRMTEMGLGKGGKIKQKIYADPYGINVWEINCYKNIKLYLINAVEFCEITGHVLPPAPSSELCKTMWCDLDDSDLKDIKGSAVFEELKKVI